MDPAALLEGLNDSQRRAAEATSGPVCILAGPGTGKTRTVTHRIAHQIATGAAAPDQVLAVTFTDRAGAELRQRLTALGLPHPVRATTFHAAAWAQLRWFWPRWRTDPLPDVLPSKARLLADTARAARVEVRDLAAEIEWAKARCIPPADYERAAAGRRTALAADRMAAVYTGYEATKAERGLVDFEDMLLLTTELLTTEPEVAAAVRDRYRHFTVDEFQDVNPAQWALLRAWLGDSAELCVVGDDAQAIYGFTGASPSYLTDFTRTFSGATTVRLEQTYRSSPQVLAVADAVLGRPDRRLVPAADAGGPRPRLGQHADAAAEAQAVAGSIAEHLAAGIDPGEIAVAYRVHSQSPPLEHALAGADIRCTVRGEHTFFGRPVIRQALAVLQQAARRPGTLRPARSVRMVEQALRTRMSWHPRREPDGDVAQERWRNLGALLDLAGDLETDGMDFPSLVQALEQEAATTTPDGGRNAVTLTTMHQAKGLEFDVVYLIGLEEGLLPISHATTADAVEEERRLLYVGITRARRHLTLSWTRRRPPSRFLEPLLRSRPEGRLAG
jgi:DNA helicase II / ATP-dependent DNA helicase PcrA